MNALAELAQHGEKLGEQSLWPMIAQLALIDNVDVGRWLFAGLFAVLFVWILLIPRRLLGQEQRVPPWWKNVRVWGLVVAATQMTIYILWR